MTIQPPVQAQPPQAACIFSLIGGSVSFILGILGNLLAAWIQQHFLGTDFTGPWLILIGLLTLTGVLFGAWIETRHRRLLLFARVSLLLSLLMAWPAVASTHPNHPPVVMELTRFARHIGG